MFEDMVIVQSALSAFNNAALVAPAFLWNALLCLPIYILSWIMGDTIFEKIGWTKSNMLGRVSLWTAILSFGWIVLFGGNYGVLRDNTSTLPFMIAAIVFVSTMFIGSHLTKGIFTGRKGVLYISLIIIALAMSDIHMWWGPLLQIGAAIFGFGIGRVAKSEMRDIPGILLIMLATTTTILMQPEFFRFGQLGSLTGVHMIALMVVGALVAATLAVRNVGSSGKIHHSAYVKLKWMVRFVVMLGIAVFMMTESVPVFLGTIIAMFVLFGMSVWHSTKTPVAPGDKLYAATIIMFGIIVSVPVISVIGIIYMAQLPHGNLWAESKYLL